MPYFTRPTLVALLFALPVHAGSSYKETYPDVMPDNVKEFFQKAVSKAYTRLFNDEGVQTCIRKNAKLDYVDPKTVKEHHGQTFLDEGKLFKVQMPIFQAYVKSGEDLPPITITQKSEDSFAYAWGNYGLVHTSEAKGKLYWHGGFEVEINIAKIVDGATSDVWAGVIAHEMLHNMMHAHLDATKVGLEKAYANDILINAAQNCVTNAKDVRDYASSYRCGGRK